jgi:hypothetical protein
MMNYKDDAPEPRLLAQVYGDPHELPGIGDYLVDAVQACRSESSNRKRRDPQQMQEGKVHIIQTRDGLAYSVSDEDLTEEELQAFEKKSVPVPIDMFLKAANLKPEDVYQSQPSQVEELAADTSSLNSLDHLLVDQPMDRIVDDDPAAGDLLAWARKCAEMSVSPESVQHINAPQQVKSLDQHTHSSPADSGETLPVSDGFDIVQKAKHYNSHPSGVECITLAEKLSFNLGSAFKYVFRRDDKENCALDLQKAKYYLNREIERLQETVDTLPHNLLAVMYTHPLIACSDSIFVERIVKAEENTWAARFYTALFSNMPLIRGIADLRAAEIYLQALIDEQERTAGDSD